MHLIDSHTHLDRFARAGELPSILQRARDAGVRSMITIGTEPDDWVLYGELVQAHPGVIHHTLGLHPCSVDADWERAFGQLPGLLASGPRPVAIGETGLDRFHLPKDADEAARLFEAQRSSFRAHLELASSESLPIVVHSRGATSECIEMIDASNFDWTRVVFHCWVDDPPMMREVNWRGGRGSFTGIATYKSAENVRQAALEQGLDRLMVETDAPYLSPEPHRGKRNEPAFLAQTAAVLARTFALELDAFADIATRNTRTFFGL